MILILIIFIFIFIFLILYFLLLFFLFFIFVFLACEDSCVRTSFEREGSFKGGDGVNPWPSIYTFVALCQLQSADLADCDFVVVCVCCSSLCFLVKFEIKARVPSSLLV